MQSLIELIILIELINIFSSYNGSEPTISQATTDGLQPPLNAGWGCDVHLKQDERVTGSQIKWLPVNITYSKG